MPPPKDTAKYDLWIKRLKEGSARYRSSPEYEDIERRRRAKISKTKTGSKREPFSDEWKKNLSIATKRIWDDPDSVFNSAEFRKGLSDRLIGRIITWGNKISENHADMSGANNPCYGLFGPNHPAYKEDKLRLDIDWSSSEYQGWRNIILTRDGYVCQMCGDTHAYGYNVHHIFPY